MERSPWVTAALRWYFFVVEHCREAGGGSRSPLRLRHTNGGREAAYNQVNAAFGFSEPGHQQ
jgi:hypothetical protein